VQLRAGGGDWGHQHQLLHQLECAGPGPNPARVTADAQRSDLVFGANNAGAPYAARRLSCSGAIDITDLSNSYTDNFGSATNIISGGTCGDGNTIKSDGQVSEE
jgi:hypothetical protein